MEKYLKDIAPSFFSNVRETLLGKYIKRNPKTPVKDQIRFWMYFADATCTGFSGFKSYGSYHGEGSPVMEQIAITSQYDIKLRKKIVRELAGMGKE